MPSTRLANHKRIIDTINYRIAGNFRKVFIFGYFEEALLFENKFPRPVVFQKYIPTSESNCPTFGDLFMYSSSSSSVLLMIMGKLYHYCTNNQKTGDPEWELMPSALESMVG